jgi:Signal transduction histidine kinase
MSRFWKILSCAIILFFTSCEKQPIHNEKEVKINHLNQEAFDLRLNDFNYSGQKADSALIILYSDSTRFKKENPDYYYGAYARALNNLAYLHYMTSDFSTAKRHIEKVLSIKDSYSNQERENTAAKVIKAKMMLRMGNLWAVDSILDKKAFRNKSSEDIIWRWTECESFITKIFLNSYYRDGKFKLEKISKLLNRFEYNNKNNEFYVDSAELSSIYYALSECYRTMSKISLPTDNKSFNEKSMNDYLNKSACCIQENLKLLSNKKSRSGFNMANCYQSISFMIQSEFCPGGKWSFIQPKIDSIFKYMDAHHEAFEWTPIHWEGEILYDSLSLILLKKADTLFTKMKDPYQTLASSNAIGLHYTMHNDLENAKQYYLQALSIINSMDLNQKKSLQKVAPKMVMGTYEGLIQSRASSDPNVLAEWFMQYSTLSHQTKQKDKIDYNYTESYANNEESKNRFTYLTIVFILSLLALAIIFFFYVYMRINNKKLSSSQAKLAKQNDALQEYKEDLVSLSKIGKDIVSKLEIDDDEKRKKFIENIYQKVYSLQIFKCLPDFSFVLYIKDDEDSLNRYRKENGTEISIKNIPFSSLWRPGIGCFLYADELFYNDWEQDCDQYANLIGISKKAIKSENIAENDAHALLFASLYSKNRDKTGVLSFQTTKKFAFDGQAITIFKMVAEYIACALDNAFQYQTISYNKKTDIERVANVETCLSIFRHDMNPYITFLQRDDIPEELKIDAQNKLFVTLKNTMRWINLSAPKGLPFAKSCFALQDIFSLLTKCVSQKPNVDIIFKPTKCEVHGDKFLIEIMLRNLINNALQHTNQGSITISACDFDINPNFVKVSVEDTGCGIPDDKISDLFRPDKIIKFDAENEKLGYGHGFGLMLCAFIIKKHDDETIRGCKIWVDSKMNEGTTFNFIIAKK